MNSLRLPFPTHLVEPKSSTVEDVFQLLDPAPCTSLEYHKRGHTRSNKTIRVAEWNDAMKVSTDGLKVLHTFSNTEGIKEK